ncbi:MAG: lysophospholipid acyltransferase family protein [Planctomycetaceae bacterium]|nr:lysophospholipid acyltransferase family protein [Planctomycetaceae bacterium]
MQYVLYFGAVWLKSLTNNQFLWKVAGFSCVQILRNLIGTIDYKWAYYDPVVDASVSRRKYICLFWHEHILSPLFLRRNCGATMLLSQHIDGDVVINIARYFGMDAVRGSSSHGGVAAIRQMMALKKHDVIAITPDGPRGPYRTMSSGAIYLASKLQLPIVLYGFGYDNAWRFRSWDKFVLPRPFSRGRVITSPPFMLPKNLDKVQLEYYRQRFESMLTQLTDEAESWATSNDTILGESFVNMGPKCSVTYYGVARRAITAE